MSPVRRHLTLKANIHAAVVDEHIVFLDALAGAYLCRECGRAKILADRATLVLSDRGLADELTESGLVEPCRARTPPRPWMAKPTTTALRPTYPPPGVRDLRDGLVALWDLSRAYRGRSFSQVLDAARAGPFQLASKSPPDLMECLEGFQRWAPYAPVTYKCLLRSFLLLRHLHRQGQSAAWVFGVTTWPFDAHCWLQVDDVVLDDELDRVARYTPIMVL